MLKRLLRITSHAGHARYLATLDEQGVGFIVRQPEIPSPYASGPTHVVYADVKRGLVIIVETAHKRYDVFGINTDWIHVYQTDEAATDASARMAWTRANTTKTPAGDMVKFDAQVVAGSGSMTWTRADLQTLFTKVCDANHTVIVQGVPRATNWKDRIDAMLRDVTTDWELFGIREAVIFFTGSVPTLTSLGRGRYQVKAAGYYATIGA